MKTKMKQTKKPKIYTKFLLPDGDEIMLIWRDELKIKEFQNEFPMYELKYKSNDHPNGIFECAKNLVFRKSILKSRAAQF